VTQTIDIKAVANAPEIKGPALITTNEDTPVSIGLSAGLADDDGSEELSITVQGVAAGAVISHATVKDDIWTIDADTISDLGKVMFAPAEHSDANAVLVITAYATESSNQDVASISTSIAIDVSAVADQPVLTVPESLNAVEDVNFDFNIAYDTVDKDSSESFSLTITDISTPKAIVSITHFGDGVNHDAGKFTILEQITGMCIYIWN